jgi:hypothetical protein
MRAPDPASPDSVNATPAPLLRDGKSVPESA